MNQMVRFLFVDATVLAPPMVEMDPEQVRFLLSCDRLNLVDGDGNWHSADVVRRIYDVSDGLITIVLEDR